MTDQFNAPQSIFSSDDVFDDNLSTVDVDDDNDDLVAFDCEVLTDSDDVEDFKYPSLDSRDISYTDDAGADNKMELETTTVLMNSPTLNEGDLQMESSHCDVGCLVGDNIDKRTYIYRLSLYLICT